MKAYDEITLDCNLIIIIIENKTNCLISSTFYKVLFHNGIILYITNF
jgi:hypothetical protein